MYQRDMPLIAKHAKASPQGLVDVIAFVLLTIQQPFHQVDRQMADVRREGAASKYLFGSKRAGYQYAVDNADQLHSELAALSEAGDTAGAVELLTTIPGLGIVKASFVAQLIGFSVACLDTHNLRRLGLPESALRLAKTVKPETRRQKIEDYIRLCEETGGSEYWWNTWCAHVAGRRGSPLASGDEVSRFHPVCLGLTN